MDALETGKRIQELRKAHGWTQKELAERLCVTDKSVSKWELGRNYPDMAMLEPLAKTLDTTVVELLGIENAPEEEKLGAVTAVAVEETERLRKEVRNRALIILMNGMIWVASQFALSYILHLQGIDGGWPHILTIGMSGFSGALCGNAIWIWWKYRK